MVPNHQPECVPTNHISLHPIPLFHGWLVHVPNQMWAIMVPISKFVFQPFGFNPSTKVPFREKKLGLLDIPPCMGSFSQLETSMYRGFPWILCKFQYFIHLKFAAIKGDDSPYYDSRVRSRQFTQMDCQRVNPI